MTPLPILFPYREIVEGHGFIAEVRLDGAALVEYDEEDQCWWASGVYPCGISAYGDSPRHAVRELQVALALFVEDVAHSEKDFPSFKSTVEDFYEQKGPSTMEEWDSAREAVRRNEISHENITKKVTDPKFEVQVANLPDGKNTLKPSSTQIAAAA